MSKRNIVLVGLLMCASACLPYSGPSSSEDIDNCGAVQSAQELLLNGSREKNIWVQALAKVRPRFGVSVFLENWKSGEHYELIIAECSENSPPQDYAYVDFLAPRIGRVEMFVEIIEGNLFAHSISLVDVFEEEN